MSDSWEGQSFWSEKNYSEQNWYEKNQPNESAEEAQIRIDSREFEQLIYRKLFQKLGIDE